MRLVVAHMRPDFDAIGAVWSIKRFLPGWEDAQVEFVPAGSRKEGFSDTESVIEKKGDVEVIHVDTGMGPLDHHQTSDKTTCAAKRAWEYSSKIKFEHDEQSTTGYNRTHSIEHEVEAGNRLMDIVVQIDHFQEVFWPDANNDRYDIAAERILDGFKMQEADDTKVLEFGLVCFDALFHIFKNKVWAEDEIAEKGISFETKWGKSLGIETINDDTMHIAQKMGYKLVIRRDPRKGYVRIKTYPEKDLGLTEAYEVLHKKDPKATWFLHVSKHMLLNGTTKNPKMVATTLSLSEIMEALKGITK